MKKGLLSLFAFGLLFGAFGAVTHSEEPVEAEAAITVNDIRISVVRPTWWEDAGAHQVLRIASTSADLTNNVVVNITYFAMESYTSDTFYSAGGGFSEYSTNGVIFYDLPLATISGKYFDLARLSTTDPATASVWNKTGAEAFNVNLLNKVWRIWNDGKGIYRPSGASAESRNVSNAVVNSLLYGYLTCSANTYNGYGAFSELNDHFNLAGRTYTESDTVLDFISTGDYGTGRGTGVTVLTSAKVAAMQSLAAGLGGGLLSWTPSSNKNDLSNIILVFLAGFTVLGGVYFYSKKRFSKVN